MRFHNHQKTWHRQIVHQTSQIQRSVRDSVEAQAIPLNRTKKEILSTIATERLRKMPDSETRWAGDLRDYTKRTRKVLFKESMKPTKADVIVGQVAPGIYARGVDE